MKLKSQIVMTLKNSKCDEIQKVKWWQNSKKLQNSNGDKTRKSNYDKTQILTKLKHSNCNKKLQL